MFSWPNWKMSSLLKMELMSSLSWNSWNIWWVIQPIYYTLIPSFFIPSCYIPSSFIPPSFIPWLIIPFFFISLSIFVSSFIPTYLYIWNPDVKAEGSLLGKVDNLCGLNISLLVHLTWEYTYYKACADLPPSRSKV